MNIKNRFVRFSSSFIVSLMFLIGSDFALAEDCIQKRNTLQAPDNIYKQVNPLNSSTETIAAGEKLYQKDAKPLACVQCHGVSGKGNGVMAIGMTPKPRDFSCSAMMKDIPDGQLFWIIKNGSKGTGMMGFGSLIDNQIWQVVSYIRKLSK